MHLRLKTFGSTFDSSVIQLPRRPAVALCGVSLLVACVGLARAEATPGRNPSSGLDEPGAAEEVAGALGPAAFAGSASAAGPATGDVPDVEYVPLADGPYSALHVAVFDSANNVVWAFGGAHTDRYTLDLVNTLHMLDLRESPPVWRSVSAGGIKPPELGFHSMVYDPLRQQLIVFGGLADRGRAVSLVPTDTTAVWLLDVADPARPEWSRETVTGNAITRFGHAAVYVNKYDAMVVSAGSQEDRRLRTDNYALLLGESPMRWVRMAHAGFTPRIGHAITYDPGTERLYVYGGLDETDRANRELIWLDLSEGIDDDPTWQRMSTSSPGLDRGFSATAFDPARRLWWFMGGRDEDKFSNDLSVLDLSADPPAWERTGVVRNGPNRRTFHVAVWDAIGNRVIFHGGTPDEARIYNDTRSLVMLVEDPPTPTASTTATPTSTPSPTIESPSVTPIQTATPGTPTSTTTAIAPRPRDTPVPSPTPPPTDAGPGPTATWTAIAPRRTPRPTLTPSPTERATSPAPPTVASVFIPVAVRNAPAGGP